MTRALLAKVHIAKKDLRLSDDDYRATLVRITGWSSSAECSERQLEQLLDEFKRQGWKPKPSKGGGGKPSDRPYVRKIYALWREAGIVGAVGNASKENLRGFVERQTRNGQPQGCSAPEFCTPTEANRISEALKAMIRRAEGQR